MQPVILLWRVHFRYLDKKKAPKKVGRWGQIHKEDNRGDSKEAALHV